MHGKIPKKVGKTISKQIRNRLDEIKIEYSFHMNRYVCMKRQIYLMINTILSPCQICRKYYKYMNISNAVTLYMTQPSALRRTQTELKQ